MRYFHKIAAGINVSQLAYAIWRQPELWNANTFRTTYPGTANDQVDDILIRFVDTEKSDRTGEAVSDSDLIWHPAADRLPQVKPLILDLMRSMEGYQLDRVIISRLKPGARIQAHTDSAGSYVNERDRARYHIVVQGFPGSLFHNGNETVQMLTGEVWAFTPAVMHSVENNSVEDRIHLMVDIRRFPA